MSQPSSSSCSLGLTPREETLPPPASSIGNPPVLTPPAESMEDKSNDASEAHSTNSTNEHSPQLTPREQTPPLPAISARQQMLRLSNPSNVCYANAGTNLLFSSPLVTRFLSALPDNNAGLNIVRQLATLEPYSVGNLKDLRKTVAEISQFKCNNDYSRRHL